MAKEKLTKVMAYRIDMETYELLQDVASKYGLSISDIARKTLTLELSEMYKENRLKRALESKENTEKVLHALRQIQESIDKLVISDNRIGVNVNQIAKAMNKKTSLEDRYDMIDLLDYMQKRDNDYNNIAKGVEKLCRTLV